MANNWTVRLKGKVIIDWVVCYAQATDAALTWLMERDDENNTLYIHDETGHHVDCVVFDK